jgi:hypothetical protein
MKLLREDIEDFEVLTESTASGAKNYYIQGPFMEWGVANRNNRIYMENVMLPAVEKYMEDYVERNRSVGTLGHEDSPRISEGKISHIITEMKLIRKGPDKGDVWGKAKVLETAAGKELKALIDGGVSFGCSSRALGSIKEGENGIRVVQSDFTISCVDAVLQPSGMSCWVDGIMEDAEWMFVDGRGWVQQYREEAKQTLKKVKSKDIEAVALKIFENYMNRL